MIGVFNDQRFTSLNKWITTIMNDWSLQWPEVYKYEWRESTMLPASRLSKKGANNNSTFYNIDWIRGLQGQSIYDYEWVVSSMTTNLQFWISGVNNDRCINILDKVESIITHNFYNIYWVRGLQPEISTNMREWCLQ